MPLFKDATSTGGINYTGRTYSGVWGDVDGDGRPDLWVSKHNSHATTANAADGSLYLNLGNGHFRDVTADRVQYLQKDMHGAVWGDPDNDGLQDLLQTAGGKLGGMTLFANDAGTLSDVSASEGLTRYAVGRGILWADPNGDGLLDFWRGSDYISSGGTLGGASTLFLQTSPGHFVDSGAALGNTATNATSPLVADLNGDGHQELILTNYGAVVRVYDTSSVPWTNIRGPLFKGVTLPNFNDMTIADFDNDGRPDMFVCRSGVTSEVAISQGKINAYLAGLPDGAQNGFSFKSTGSVTLQFSKQDGTIHYNQLHVGSTGYQPLTANNVFKVTLDPTDPLNQGIAAHGTGGNLTYFGYNAATQHWTLQTIGSSKLTQGFTISSTQPISDLQTQGIDLNPVPTSSQLLINTLVPVQGSPTPTTRFVDHTADSGVGAMSLFCNFAAAGDFDNDGYMDIYVDQASPALNRHNVLLHNDGAGHFTLVTNSGAPGPQTGTGGPVALADWDQDGFLDLVSLNGGNEPPFEPLNNTGPVTLYHNLGTAGGNTNDWLEVRLHGDPSSGSTADAVGAKVTVTVGGKTYYREMVLGQHIKAQDFHDLHFGLGDVASGQVDRVVVKWPSGHQTVLTKVPVGQLLDIDELSTASGQVGWLDHLGGDHPTDLAALDLSVSDWSWSTDDTSLIDFGSLGSNDADVSVGGDILAGDILAGHAGAGDAVAASGEFSFDWSGFGEANGGGGLDSGGWLLA